MKKEIKTDDLNMRFEWHDIETVVPNEWNPNVQDDEMFQNTVASICSEGFVDPVTARDREDATIQIIDGEHRWKALLFIRDHSQELDEDVAELLEANLMLQDMIERGVMPVINLGEVDDDTARRLTLQLNGVKGQDEPLKLARVVTELKNRASLEQLAARLPMTQQRLGELVDMLAWSMDQNVQAPDPDPDDPDPPEQWITYEFRFPKAAQPIIDSEMERIGELLGYDALEMTDVQRGLVLEKICVLSADTPTESLE